MKKTTKGDLSKKLLKYGALSAAVMGIADASGQIIYTDIVDVTLSGEAQNYNFDLDNNGQPEYQLGNRLTGNVVLLPINAAGTAVGGDNGFVGFTTSGYNYPSNLVADVLVDSNSPNVIGAGGTMYFGNCDFSSQWCGGVTDGYLGLIFTIDGAIHYGWARLDVAAGRTSVTVKDYAYNSVAGESILTGQQTLGIADNTFNDFSYFVDTSKNLNMVSSKSLEEVTIFDLLGKEVKQVRLNSSRATVPVSDLNTGIYLAKATAEGQTKTFKIVVK
jgi:hypothetical protein